jgi:iron complex transport system permease protein
MMLLAFEEGESRTMGIDARRMQIVVVGLCTLLTAIIVSFCGAVGFVGFLVPHLARRLVGPNFKYLLPASVVLGGVFVLGAYLLLMVTLGGSYQTMLGMFISIGGAAVFLVTALRGRGRIDGTFK